MKRRILLISIILCSGLIMSGQTFIWQDFSSNQMPPTGWTINGLPAQWSISNSNNAGGTAPEAMFTYTTGTYTTRLISPMENTTGLTSIKLSFKHYYDFYTTPAPKVGVATRSHNGAWNTVWEITPTSSTGPEEIDTVISNGDVGQAEFQICFYLNGNMYNINYWYLDDVLLFNPLNRDGFLYSLNGTPTYFASNGDVKGSIMNVGIETITSAVVDWQLDSGPVHSSTFSGLSVPTQGSYDFTSTDAMNPALGQHLLTVWIQNVNGSPDLDQTNDTLRKTVNKICYSNHRVPFYEEFTSSTCDPCAAFNANFVPWCTAHDSLITLLKYQMNWPGTGDPYYTAEGGVRRDYYGVGWVPWLECIGNYVNTDMASVQSAYDQANVQLGMFDIASTHTFNNHIVNVCANILPFYSFPNATVYISVFEKVTYNNHSTNGETSFQHVMMKMIPDANGTPISFADRQPVTICDTVDLSGTHIERWNDLMLVVWVQDSQTKEVYQSAYSVENGTFGHENRLQDIKINGSDLPGFSPDVFTYNVTLPGGTVIVPDVVGVPIDTNETVIVIPPQTLPGATTIDVFAQDNIDHNLYTVNFDFASVVDPKKVEAVNIHPNPTSGLIYISGAYHSRITVYSMNGVVMKTLEDFTGTSLNFGDLNKGVYLLKIERRDKNVVQTKVVLL